VFLQLLVLPNATSFVCCQIHFGKFFFFFFNMMAIVPMKKARLVIMVDDLNFKIKDVAFEAKVFNRYGTFDRIANRNMEDPSYAYLQCDLLDRASLTTITLRVKSFYIKMHEQHLQENMFMKVENFGIESKSKRGFEKGDMHVVITIESTTIMSLIHSFQPKLIPISFHWIPLESSKFVFKVGGLMLQP
jgi:diacylglycerol kinase family enzyme